MSQNPIINQLIYPSFQGVNRLFVLSFENTTDKTTHTGYNLLKVRIKDCNVTIGKRNLFAQPIKNYENHVKTFEKLLLVKKMITRLIAYFIFLISKETIK